MGLDCIAQAMRNEDVAEESHVSREKTMQLIGETTAWFFLCNCPLCPQHVCDTKI